MKVIDASALLAFLLGEPGSEAVSVALTEGAYCSAVNWSEVAQKVRSKERNWDLSRALLQAYELQVEAVTEADAERAAELWRAGSGLSIADRICLAVTERLNTVVLTADKQWGDDAPVIQIR